MLDKLFIYNENKISKNIAFYFIIVVIINIIFKSFYLDYSSYWYDEIISIKAASEDFGHIKHVSDWDKNPPFYYYCLSVWIKLFNDSEYISRLLSVLFSSLAGGVLFVFANKHFNKTTAIISSLLYLASNMLYFYSHEARAYSLVVLLSLISSYLFFELKDKPSLKYTLLLGFINFLLIYTHYISGLVLVFQFLLMFAFEKKQKTAYLYSCLIILVLTIIRFTKKQILLLIAFNKSEITFWLKKSDFDSLIQVLSEFLYNKNLIIPLIITIIIGLVYVVYLKNKPFTIIYFYCFLVGLGSIFILYFLGKLTPIFLDRYLIFTVPFIIIIVSYCFSCFKHQTISIILSALFFTLCAFKIDYKAVKPMDYKNVVFFIKRIKTNTDLIIVKTKDVKPLFCYYYEKDYLKNKKTELDPEENIIFCNSWSDVSVDLKIYKRIIVIDSFQDLNPNEPEFKIKLNQIKKKIIETYFYQGARISFYD